MVTTTDHAPEQRIIHPTREGFAAIAYYVTGHLLNIAGLLVTVGFMYWVALHPTSFLGWGSLGFAAAVWALGRLRRWILRSAWDEVPGAYRTYSMAAGDLNEIPISTVLWDHIFGLARLATGMAGGLWLASRLEAEPDARALVLATMGALLATVGAAQACTTAWNYTRWQKRFLGEIWLDTIPLSIGVTWVSAAMHVEGARPVLGWAISTGLFAATVWVVIAVMRRALRPVQEAPLGDGPRAYAATAQQRAEREQQDDEPELGWWATWRRQLPLSLFLSVGLAAPSYFDAGLWGALVIAAVLLLLSTVFAPLGYRLANPKHRAE